jgi:hypothetical protein
MQLFANRTCLYFIYAIIGAAVSGELSSEFDYTDNYPTFPYRWKGEKEIKNREEF